MNSSLGRFLAISIAGLVLSTTLSSAFAQDYYGDPNHRDDRDHRYDHHDDHHWDHHGYQNNNLEQQCRAVHQQCANGEKARDCQKQLKHIRDEGFPGCI